MGQQLFKVDLEKINSTETNSIQSWSFNDRISSIFPWKIDQIIKNSTERDLNEQNILITKIRNEIFQLTKTNSLQEFDTQMNEIASFIETSHQNSMKTITETWEKQKQLRISFDAKSSQDSQLNSTISSSTNNDKLVSLAIESLISILLILIKSVERTDPTIVQQILSLSIQLVEQIPMKSFSNSNFFFQQSLKPIGNFLEDLSYSSDGFISQRSIEILFHLSLLKCSLKDLFPLFNRFIFDQKNFYNFKNIFSKLNENLSKSISNDYQG